MATIYVAGSGSDSSGNGSTGSPYRTLTKANQVANPGDTVLVRNGTYGRASLTKANVIWRADTGHAPVVDGGFSASLFTGSGGKNKKLPNPAKSGYDTKPLITIGANGMTFDGFTVQNAPDAGISIEGSGTTIKNNLVFFTYDTAIMSNVPKVANTADGKPIHDVLVENNRCYMASMSIFDPERTGSYQGVTGVMKFGNTDGGLIVRGNHLAFGFGEGLNYGKFNTDKYGATIIENNTIHDCNHTHIYVNRSTGVIVRNNRVFSTGQPTHMWDGDVPAGLSVTDEHVETRFSNRCYFYNNLSVNMAPLIRHTIQDQPTGVQKDIYFGFNTLVAGPNTNPNVWSDKQGKWVVKQPFIFDPRPGTNGIFENNIIDQTHCDPASGPQNGSFAGVGTNYIFRNNSWSHQPASQGRGAGDQTGAISLSDPSAPVRLTGTYPEYVTSAAALNFGHTLDPRNYRLTSASTRAINKASNGGPAGNMTPPSQPRGIDFFGQARDSAPDNGFHEYGSVTAPGTLEAEYTHVPTSTTFVVDTLVVFTDVSRAVDTEITTWSWVIKKGATTMQTFPTRNASYRFASAGTWTVALTISDGDVSDTFTKTFTVTAAPNDPIVVSSFSRSPGATTIAEGTTIVFTNTSTIQNTTLTSLLWEVKTFPLVGVIDSDAASPFSYQFNDPGTFTVHLTVNTAASVSDTSVITITVEADTEPSVVADFDLSATTILEGETVSVTDNLSAASNTTISGYQWTWGDGATSSTETPSHTYTTPGTYNVTLHVSTAAGVSATHSQTVTVRAIVASGDKTAFITCHREALDTATGPQTITAAALGTQVPKGFLVSMSLATADGTAVNGAMLCVGGSDGTRQWVHTRSSTNGTATSETARRGRDNAVLMAIDGNGAITGLAEVTNLVPGGVEINITDAFPAAYLATFTFFAGDDMKVNVGTSTGPSATEEVTVMTGIDQDGLIVVATWGALDTATANADMSIGFANGTVQVCLENEDRDGRAKAETRVRHRPYVATTRDTTSSYGVMELVEFSTTGFTVKARDGRDMILPFSYLAFECGKAVHISTEVLSTSSPSTHPTPFEAQAAIGVLSTAVATSTNALGVVGELYGLYTGCSASEFSTSISVDYDAETMATRSRSDSGLCGVAPDGTAVFDGAGTYDVGDVEFVWATAPASAYILTAMFVEVGDDVEDPPPGDKPVPHINSSTRAGTARFAVTFDATGSNPNGGGDMTYLWDFGDGTTSSLPVVTKVYARPGTYTVSLTVSNTNGEATAVEVDYISVSVPKYNTYLVGPFTSDDVDENSTNDTIIAMPDDEQAGSFGSHSHSRGINLVMPEMNTEQIAEFIDQVQGSTVAYGVYDTDNERIVIIKSDGAFRYLVTTG